MSSSEIMTNGSNSASVMRNLAVMVGAAARIRTLDRPLTKRLLYHWSYDGIALIRQRPLTFRLRAHVFCTVSTCTVSVPSARAYETPRW